ncbi:MAG TPA: aspartate/glutamate racemase family protein [Bacteroidales bacterium]|nr:aspartate/glutamate racemase family protein [Bacteroidales bacterium]
MKTIGLIGGTGWVSTSEYYRIINEETNRRLGGLNFARCILYSLDYGEIDRMNSNSDNDGLYRLLSSASKKVVGSGADCLLLCANTLHQFAEKLQKETDVPLIHIASVTADEINRQGLSKIGLLGTRQTMEMDFYTKNLEKSNITSIVPDKQERDYIQSVISDELLKNLFLKESKECFLDIIGKLISRGAQGIVLGCTEIPLLIKQEDISIPLFNTLKIHALAAVDYALGS